MIRAALLITALSLGPPSSVATESRNPAPAEALLAEAGAAFDEAVKLLKQDPIRARSLLDVSIARHERIITEGGTRSGGLYYNIGNAHMLKGDLGRAILNYRRAQLLTPGDENLAANLGVARARVTPRVARTPENRLLGVLFFWHEDLSERARFAVFVASFVGFWVLALLRFTLGAGGAWRRWTAAALAVLGAGALGSLLVERSERLAARDAVVIAESVVGHKGPDESAYEPSFTEPLGAGVEVRVVERRARWALVALSDGRRTWIPDAALESVVPTFSSGSSRESGPVRPHAPDTGA